MDWAFRLKFELYIPRIRELENFIRNAKFWKIQDGGRRHLGFTKMLIAPPGLNYLAEIELYILGIRKLEISSEMLNFEKIQDGGRRHVGFTKMLITSAGLSFLAEIWTALYLALGKLEISSEMLNLKNPRWRRAAILDLLKCYTSTWMSF